VEKYKNILPYQTNMKQFLARVFTLILLFFTDPSVGQAQVRLPLQLQFFVKELETQKHQLQGGAIAILYQGHVVYKTTFGHQRGDDGPIAADTLFPLASVSKAVTATAIALLVDKGSLNLDEELKLPYLQKPVSISNILSHTTGYQFSGNAQIEQGMTRLNILEILKKRNCSPPLNKLTSKRHLNCD